MKTCPCEDSNGIVCGKKMTSKEWKQDGMCQICAGEVWNEMTHHNYRWSHKHEKTNSLLPKK